MGKERSDKVMDGVHEGGERDERQRELVEGWRECVGGEEEEYLGSERKNDREGAK